MTEEACGHNILYNMKVFSGGFRGGVDRGNRSPIHSKKK